VDKRFEVRSKIVFSYDAQYLRNFFIIFPIFLGNAELAIWATLIFARFWAKVAEAVLARLTFR
jgi:hypothetical protein